MKRREDPWLDNLLRVYSAKMPDLWGQALVRGMEIRFRRAEDPGALVDLFMAGGQDNQWRKPVDWAEALTDKQADYLVGLVISDVVMMEGELEDLPEVHPKHHAAARMRFLDNRDDLESILCVVRIRGLWSKVDASVMGLDEVGKAYIAEHGYPEGMREERNLRALQRAPESWWVDASQF